MVGLTKYNRYFFDKIDVQYFVVRENMYIIIFDGQCNLCNFFVNFIIKRDRQALFSFVPLKTSRAKSLMTQYDLELPDADTIVLIKDENFYLRSKAIFEIIKDLQGLWFLLRIFRFLPASFNDFLYRSLSKNRYKIFGKSQHCMTPSEDIRSRFLMDAD